MAFPAGFLFDMDGLLLDTERVSVELALEMAAKRGWNRAEAEVFFLGLVGGAAAGTREKLQGFLGSAAALDQFWADWNGAMKERLAPGIPVKSTVRDALGHLTRKGARMAVVTSSKGDTARHHLERAGLLSHFEHVRGGDEVSANKPDPAPYLEAAMSLGVPASDCVAFEDSDKGLAAAVAAGCRSVQIPDLRPKDIPLPDLGQLVAPDLATALRKLGLLKPL